jgi:hypothetical protein
VEKKELSKKKKIDCTNRELKLPQKDLSDEIKYIPTL